MTTPQDGRSHDDYTLEERIAMAVSDPSRIKALLERGRGLQGTDDDARFMAAAYPGRVTEALDLIRALLAERDAAFKRGAEAMRKDIVEWLKKVEADPEPSSKEEILEFLTDVIPTFAAPEDKP